MTCLVPLAVTRRSISVCLVARSTTISAPPTVTKLVTRAYSAVACAYTVMPSITAQTQSATAPGSLRGSEPRVTSCQV